MLKEHGPDPGGRDRVPHGAVNAPGAGQGQPRRHAVSQRPGVRPQRARRPAGGIRPDPGGRGRVPRGVARTSRSWSRPTPPSPSSATAWRPATSTSASCSPRRAGRRRRSPSTARRRRSSATWPGPTPPSPTSATAWRTPRSVAASCSRRRAGCRRRRPCSGSAAAIYQDLADQNPKVPDYADGLASALTNLGDVVRSSGRTVEARDAYDRAIALRERPGQGEPDHAGLSRQPGLLVASARAGPPRPGRSRRGRGRRPGGRWRSRRAGRRGRGRSGTRRPAAMPRWPGLAGTAGSGVSASEATSEADAAIDLPEKGRRHGLPHSPTPSAPSRPSTRSATAPTSGY